MIAPLLAAALAQVGLQPVDWPHFAGDAARSGLSAGLPPPLDAPGWLLAPAGVAFVGQAGTALLRREAYAIGSEAGAPRLIAIDARQGKVRWMAPVEPPALSSWSMPAIDPENYLVLVASGSSLRAIDAISGSPRWSAPLDRPVVNASPCIAGDRGGRVRAFISDYDPFGGAGSLYCINLSPFDALRNPFAPGERVWRVPLGSTSGNTPAYADGIVCCASIGEGGGGQVRAFHAHATSAEPPLWTFQLSGDEGFLGGLTIRGGAVFAATYDFFGGPLNSTLVRLDAATGEPIWQAPCARTSATPIALEDGRVLLSGGIDGFGSAPTLQLFDAGGALAWDVAIDTWVDADHDGVLDPGEYLRVGGWTHQPIAIGGLALVGGIGASATAAGSELRLIDLARLPDEPGFIAASFTGAGSTPAASWEGCLSLGPPGLHAFGPVRDDDVNGDGRVDAEDLYAWVQGLGERDVDGDGDADGRDRELLAGGLARQEEGQPR